MYTQFFIELTPDPLGLYLFIGADDIIQVRPKCCFIYTQSRINGQHSWAKFFTLLRFSMQPRRSKGSPSGIHSATKYDVGMPPTLGMNACAKELATNS
jgi:hypothetical protein